MPFAGLLIHKNLQRMLFITFAVFCFFIPPNFGLESGAVDKPPPSGNTTAIVFHARIDPSPSATQHYEVALYGADCQRKLHTNAAATAMATQHDHFAIEMNAIDDGGELDEYCVGITSIWNDVVVEQQQENVGDWQQKRVICWQNFARTYFFQKSHIFHYNYN